MSQLAFLKIEKINVRRSQTFNSLEFWCCHKGEGKNPKGTYYMGNLVKIQGAHMLNPL